MAVQLRGTGCCGMVELDNISQVRYPINVIRAFCRLNRHVANYRSNIPWENQEFEVKCPPLVLFSGVIKRVTGDHASNRKDNYGEKLKIFILRHKLGKVVESGTGVNRTQNTLQAWIWTPDSEALSKWWKKDKETIRGKRAARNFKHDRAMTYNRILDAPPPHTPPTPNHVIGGIGVATDGPFTIEFETAYTATNGD